MSQKKDERRYADLLDTTDVGYLAAQFDEDEAFIRGMNDAEWCEYLGCTVDELPYHLFEDTGEPFEPVIDLVGEDEEFDGETLFDIESFLQKEFKKPAPKPVVKPTSLVHNYSRPSAFAPKWKAPNLPIPHHFELVK
jgi:hypothetical protein